MLYYYIYNNRILFCEFGLHISASVTCNLQPGRHMLNHVNIFPFDEYSFSISLHNIVSRCTFVINKIGHQQLLRVCYNHARFYYTKINIISRRI